MPTRNVYLGHVDIDTDARIDLSHHDHMTDSSVLLYLFRYGILADQVLMQGSAPLKSKRVLNAYFKLAEAFRRNENHEPIPVFAFSLSDEAEGYVEYIRKRYILLKKLGDENNPESTAYRKNKALESASALDMDLAYTDVPRRKKSVSSIFRKGLASSLKSNAPEKTGISHETSDRAKDAAENAETIQTFNLISSLNLGEVEQARKLYAIARACYRQANAAAIGAVNSDDSHIWSSVRISEFYEAIGIYDFLRVRKSLSSEMLFKIRRCESFRLIREEYFLAQSDMELLEFNTMLKALRVGGRVRSAIRQSPSALISLIFEALNEAKLGYRPINKAGEIIAKNAASGHVDALFAKRCYRLYDIMEKLSSELKLMAKTA